MNRYQEAGMPLIFDRIYRACKLDANLYEEVESDTNALKQATAVVVLSSFAAGIGTIRTGGASGILFGTLSALIGWYIWAYLTYLVGTKIFPEPQTSSSHSELLRTIGFSSSPGLLRVFGILPGVTEILFLGISMWMLIAMVIAVRQALDYKSTIRAVGVCLVGWFFQIIAFLVLFFLFGKIHNF